MLRLLPLLLLLPVFAAGCDTGYEELAASTAVKLATAEAALIDARSQHLEELASKPVAAPGSPAWREHFANRTGALQASVEAVDVAKIKYEKALLEHEKSIILRDSLHSGVTFAEASDLVDQYQNQYNKAYAEFDTFFSEVEATDLTRINTVQESANIEAKAARLREAKRLAEDNLRKATALRDVLRPSID